MRKIVVLRNELLSPSVIGLQLSCANQAPFTFTPGQWVNLHVAAAGGGQEKRAYSIASAPDAEAPERFDLAVTLVEDGRVSGALHRLRPGDVLEMDGPYGYFTREDREDALLVGTGTGVAPLRSMLSAALAQPSGPRLALLFGVRTQADILYRAELETLAAKHERFTFLPTLSRAGPEDAWSGRRGYVQTHVAELVASSGRPHVYVCGLSPMINAVRTLLKQQLGYDRKHIHSERYD